jgi:hypothetical protein
MSAMPQSTAMANRARLLWFWPAVGDGTLRDPLDLLQLAAAIRLPVKVRKPSSTSATSAKTRNGVSISGSVCSHR